MSLRSNQQQVANCHTLVTTNVSAAIYSTAGMAKQILIPTDNLRLETGKIAGCITLRVHANFISSEHFCSEVFRAKLVSLDYKN